MSPEQKSIKYARIGIILGLLSGFLWSLDGLMVEYAQGFPPFDMTASGSLFILIAAVCAGLHDIFAALFVTLYNHRAGRLKEVGRSLVSRPGRSVIMGSLIGAVCGMGAYMAALQLAPSAYVMPITALYPGVAVILAVIFLKERVKPLAVAGILICITGAVVIGYAPPETGETGTGTIFTLGIIFAIVATIGWGAEGVFVTSGMDFIEPDAALNIRYLVSSLFFMGFVLASPLFLDLPDGVSVTGILKQLATSRGTLVMAATGTVGGMTFVAWYRSMNMTGVSRAMALNISYALWAVLLGVFFTDLKLTPGLVTGALCIFLGSLFVIGNPKDMLTLRDID